MKMTNIKKKLPLAQSQHFSQQQRCIYIVNPLITIPAAIASVCLKQHLVTQHNQSHRVVLYDVRENRIPQLHNLRGEF